MATPTDPETRLTRAAGAEALTEAGYPTATATLATLACRGGGPPYRLYGARVIYRSGRSARLGGGASKSTDAQHIRGRH